MHSSNAGIARAPLLSSTYRRRQPEATVLYRLIAGELATFRQRIDELFEVGLPRFILEDFER